MARSPCSPKDLTSLVVNTGTFIARKIQLKTLNKSSRDDYPKGLKDVEDWKYLQMLGGMKETILFSSMSVFLPSETFLSTVSAGHLWCTASPKLLLRNLI